MLKLLDAENFGGKVIFSKYQHYVMQSIWNFMLINIEFKNYGLKMYA